MARIASVPEGKIADFIDGKIRNDTPEEYVRQNIERRLVLELGYSREQIAVEFPVRMGSKSVRLDLAIFPEGDDHKQENINIIVECKRDTVEPSSKLAGTQQLQSYMAACPNADWGMWTNGRFKAVYRKIVAGGRVSWGEPNDIPSKDGGLKEIDRPGREDLIQAADDNLLFSFKTCHNHIYVTDGLQKQPAFFELLKVIFCKIWDERNIPHALQFYATEAEKASHDGRLSVAKRIGRIFDSVSKAYPTIFEAGDTIRLEPRSLAYIVGELQRYSFLDTNIDVKGKAYEELVGANLRGDRGEFFTPRNVQRMAISMLDLQEDERILDPACGTGGFLVIAMSGVIERLKQNVASNDPSSNSVLLSRIRDIASTRFFGFDINPDLVKATKMNMVMNNDGAGHVLRQDSLLHPHQWPSSFKEELGRALGVDASMLRGPDAIGYFDVIATNPPFGSKLPIKDEETLAQYQLARVWKSTDDVWEPTSQLQSSVPPEILFIERCWQFLRPGGRMAIVLPDAILGAPGLRYVREWMLKTSRLIASVDLHPDTFQPRNGTQTSVLILQKKTPEEIEREHTVGYLTDYPVFMAPVRNIGHDKRGNTVYRRSPKGLILLEDLLDRNGAVREAVKAIADDTPLVADAFLQWKKQAVLGW